MQSSWSSGLRAPNSPWRDDRLPQLSHVTLTDRASPTSLANISYGRDDAGQLNSQTTGLSGTTDSFLYNTLNQLTTKNSTATWNYDAADNLTKIPTTSGSNQQVFDNANQLCFATPNTGTFNSPVGTCPTAPADANTKTYSYDSRGNRTQVDTAGIALPTAYTYDQANRLTSVTQPTAGNQGGYTSLTPTRILFATNTVTNRIGVCPGSTCNKLTANADKRVQITGQGGVPGSGVSAVVINVTMVNPAINGSAVLWANGDSKPNTSNINFVTGQNISGLAIVKIGTGGEIKINSTAASDVIFDVEGYYSTADGGAANYYNPLSPSRIMDTRSAYRSGACPTMATPNNCVTLTGTNTLDIQVTGRGNVPSSGVKSVAINLTVTNPTTSGNAKVWSSRGCPGRC